MTGQGAVDLPSIQSSRKLHRVAVGLGSNMGDRVANLQEGVAGLVNILGDLRYSGVFETVPLYVVDQPPFLNACSVGTTSLPACELLAALQQIERRAGRQDGGLRFGPRPLDLDLLLYGQDVITVPGLSVPHSCLRERSFVLVPLAELASDWIVPESTGKGATRVGELARAAGTEGLTRTDILLGAA